MQTVTKVGCIKIFMRLKVKNLMRKYKKTVFHEETVKYSLMRKKYFLVQHQLPK